MSWTIRPEHANALTPKTIFDVGVHKGTRGLYAAFPDAYYVLVEPLRENRKAIKQILHDHRGEHIEAAAGSQPGTATINVEPQQRARSSFLNRAATTASGDVTEPREVPVCTLDGIVRDRALDEPFGLKIDTEGFELEVLAGARKVLASSQFVITETSIGKRFEERPYTAADLLTVLREHGFAVFDVLGGTRRYADLLFLRS